MALRRSVRHLQIALSGVVIAGLAILLMGATRGPEVLRARGLVIVDEQGHDRILMGAPTPASAQRARRDAQTESLVFLGPDGSDRVIVGQTHDPQVEGKTLKRIAEGWGMAYFDPKGTERGGIGYLGNGRAAVVLDRPHGDAIGMLVDDSSKFAGLLINYPEHAGNIETAIEVGVQEDKVAMVLHDPKGRDRARLQLFGDERPTFDLRDAASARN